MIDLTMSEAQLKKEVLSLAKERGWKVFHLTHDGVKKPQKDAKGWPDLTLARQGRVIFLELKRTGQDLEPAQREWRDAIIGSGVRGGYYLIIKPEDLNGFVQELLR